MTGDIPSLAVGCSLARTEPGGGPIRGTGRVGVGQAHCDALLIQLDRLPPDDVNRAAVRTQVIEGHLPLATNLARRFVGRGEPLSDLIQVAVIGLIKAVDRYDVNRAAAFTSFAVPTILGEIKRHFRDTTWNVRVPRRMQELTLRLTTVTEELVRVLQRWPTTAELADRMGVSDDDVMAARCGGNAYRPLSIEQPVPGGDDRRLIDALGVLDAGIEAVDRRETVRLWLASLTERERRIIALRFFAEMTQAQIAADIGVSQMHVSRLLARSLAELHTCMFTDSPGAAA